jgi:hypothetical protein
MRRILLATLALATTAFVPPKHELQVEIAGVYDAVGTHPDGSSYQGKATLTRISADRYSIRFDMPNGVFRALCVRSRDILGCAWGSLDGMTAAVMRPAGNGLYVTWVTDADAALGRETVAADQVGSGTDPAGNDYTSTWQTTAVGTLERVSWTRKAAGVSKKYEGWGLRDGSVLIAGFTMPNTGAAFYRIEANGALLSGEWMDPMTPQAGRGSETLTR